MSLILAFHSVKKKSNNFETKGLFQKNLKTSGKGNRISGGQSKIMVELLGRIASIDKKKSLSKRKKLD